MKLKLFVLLVLAAIASSSFVWAESAKAKAAASQNSSFCCGFCIPGEPCESCH